MPPQAMLLDLDGTLADSLAALRLAYREFLDQFHAVATDAEFDSLNGPPLLQVVGRLKAAHGLELGEQALLDNYFSSVDRAYARVAPSPGAWELLQKARFNQCVVGIVTSNTAKRVQGWLDVVGLSQMIDFIVSADEVRHGKPNPEPYLLAAKRTSRELATIVAVEDSPQGARSATSAGLETFVLMGDPVKKIEWPEGVQRVESLHALSERLWRTP